MNQSSASGNSFSYGITFCQIESDGLFNYLIEALNTKEIYMQYSTAERDAKWFLENKTYVEKCHELCKSKESYKQKCQFIGKKTIAFDLDETLIISSIEPIGDAEIEGCIFESIPESMVVM